MQRTLNQPRSARYLRRAETRGLPRGSPGGRHDMTELVRREAAEFVAAPFPSLRGLNSVGRLSGRRSHPRGGGGEVTNTFRSGPSSISELLSASSARAQGPSCAP